MILPIPHPDPMPLPAPVWLLRTLLLLTFFLHVLFMNCLLGGTAIALVCRMRRKSSEFSARLAGDLGQILPSVFAFTITLGVAALLFLQVLYGQFLYASSILGRRALAGHHRNGDSGVLRRLRLLHARAKAETVW